MSEFAARPYELWQRIEGGEDAGWTHMVWTPGGLSGDTCWFTKEQDARSYIESLPQESPPVRP